MIRKHKKKSRKPKYLSVRKALQELKVNEEELKKMVARGYVKTIQEQDGVKYNEEDIEHLKASQTHPSYHPSAPIPQIEDENLYESSDRSFDSLFLSGSTIARAEDLEAAALLKSKLEENLSSPSLQELQNNLTPSENSKENFIPSPQKDLSSTSPKSERSLELPSEESQKKKEEAMAVHQEKVSSLEKHSQNGRNSTARNFIAPFPYQKEVESDKVLISSKKEETKTQEEKKFLWFSIALGIIIAFLLGWTIYLLGKPSSSPILWVRLGKIQKKQFIPKLTAFGYFIGKKESYVYPKTKGKIIKIYKKAGEPIQKNDILAELGGDSLQIVLQNTKIHFLQKQLEYAKIMWYKLNNKLLPKEREKLEKEYRSLHINSNLAHRKNSLFQYISQLSQEKLQWYLAKLHYDIVWEELQTAKNILQKNKQNFFIRSPIEGTLIKWKSTKGCEVDPHTEVAMVASSQKIARVKIPPAFVHSIYPNMIAELKIHLKKEKVLPGKVLKIESPTKEASLEFFLDLEAVGESLSIPIGTPVTVNLTLPKKEGILVPKQAVVQDKSASVIFFALPQSKERMYSIYPSPVKLGLSNSIYYEILDGIQENNTIVLECNFGMRWLTKGTLVKSLDDF